MVMRSPREREVEIWAGENGHSTANGSIPLRLFFKRSNAARTQLRGGGPHQLATRFRVLQRV